MKTCEFCGKEFEPTRPWQKYCKGSHFRNCPVCGMMYEETTSSKLSKPPVTCSYTCRQKLITETSLNRYGCEYYFQSAEGRKKTKDTMMKRYQVPHAMMSNYIKAKAINSIYNKYYEKDVDSIDIIYEDNQYIVFKSQCETILDNVKISDNIRSKGKTPVVCYLNESEDSLIGQLELGSNITIDANELTVYKLTTDVAKEFMLNNDYNANIQGITLALGLVKDQTIYQAMIFGVNKHNKDYKLQLLRICNKSNHTVLGGLDKLSSVASQQFEICRCIAYQDQSKPFMNSRLESIGMKFLKHNHGKKTSIAGQETYDLGVNVYVFG